MQKNKYQAVLFPLALVLTSFWQSAHASYAYYVGKNLTEEGYPLIGGSGEEASSHWLEIVEGKNWGKNATITVGVTEKANIPGELIEIPQVSRTHRYLSMFYSEYKGFPPALSNGGINEYSVAIRDVWSPSRKDLVKETPTPQRGPQYSDLAKIALERAKTAREAVEIIGDLNEKYGFSTYGGNSHLIADPNEGWVVIEMAGGQGLWAAERLDENTIKVLYPGYIEEFPVNFQEHDDFMGADHIVDFAIERGWFDPSVEDVFNINNVYGKVNVEYRSSYGKYMSPGEIEEELNSQVPVSVEDMQALVRDPRITDEESGYGQVASLEPQVFPELIKIWVSPIGAVAAPFNVWWLGVDDIPMEYGQHRYLTKGADKYFLNVDFQHQEASEFAGRLFKRVLYYTCSDPNRYLPLVKEWFEFFESDTFESSNRIERIAKQLLENDQMEEAQFLMTNYSNTRSHEAIVLGRVLVSYLEMDTQLRDSIVPPVGSEINAVPHGIVTPNCLVGADPDAPKPIR